MDGYPLNLILAVATASASIFLGFLPTKSISSSFFMRECAKFILAWVLVGLTCPSKIAHYPFFYAFLSFAAWWSFRKDNTFTGKMWLSVASGLGISTGIMFILTVTPRAYPPGLTPLAEGLLLASIYLGGAIIGLAYVCFALIQGTRSGVTQGVVQRYVGFLFWLSLARAATLLATFSISSGYFGEKTTWYNPPASTSQPLLAYKTEGHLSMNALAVVILIVCVLPLLAFLAQRATGFSSRTQPTQLLYAIIGLGFITEIGARLFVL